MGTLETGIVLPRLLTMLGALGCSYWVIYREFAAHGFILALLSFFGFGVICKFGLSPLFAVAASILYFHYAVVGVWLPVISYVFGAMLLYVDWKHDNLRRRTDPFNLGVKLLG